MHTDLSSGVDDKPEQKSTERTLKSRKEELLATVCGSVIKTTGRCAAVRHRPQFTGFEHLPKEMNDGMRHRH